MQSENIKDHKITVASIILDTLDEVLKDDSSTLLFGLGVNDPKGVFGTTTDLYKKYTTSRVFETPTSENAMTGVGVGLALAGFRPIMVHQRLDFFLLAMDQLVNSAAKWHFMFGGESKVSLTIRLILGRGWGQGPTHSQNLHAWFAHIPGLKVVIPAFASDVKGLLTAAIRDPNPVIFIEDRWIHSQLAEIGELKGDVPLGVANLVTTGDNLTLVSSGYMSVLALKAVKYAKEKGLKIDLIDLRTIKPLDEKMILESVKKTGRLIVVDSGVEFGSFGAYIISRISSYAFDYLKIAPKLLASPDVPEPTSHGVIEEFKITPIKIAESIFEIMNLDIPNDLVLELKSSHHDVPDSYFTGPF
jgi:pyruvate dehydrogenase E1 component beta subunit